MEIEAPTFTQLISVTPEEGKVFLQGEPIIFEALLSGRKPKKVHILIHVSGEKEIAYPMFFKHGEENFYYNLQIPKIETSFQYQILAGDYLSRKFSISVVRPPMIEKIQISYHFPEYTRLPETISETGDIEAPEGTLVTLQAKTVAPIKEGTLSLNSTSYSMTLSGSNLLTLTDLKITHDGSYVIRCQDE